MTILRIAGVMLAAVVAAQAQPSLEASRLSADAAFQAAAAPKWAGALTVTGRLLQQATLNAPQPDQQELFKVRLAPADGKAALKAGPSQELDLAALRNRHLKTSLQFTLGGKNVWISGSFDSQQNAYVSVLPEGEGPRFYNVKGLLEKDEQQTIGSATYKISLAPNIVDQMESEIVLKNLANRKDRESVTIREMLSAVSAAGAEVKAGGQTYKTFYYDDIKGNVQDTSTQSFAFVLIDAKGEFHVFLVPANLVPSDKLAVFKMYENHRVGLQQAGGKLRIFDNP